MGRSEDLLARISERREHAIDALIEDRQSEELFLDFKRSSDNGSGTHLSGDDRKNLAKAISGFGNSEGGIIVWGVDCKHSKPHGDVAGAKVKVKNAKRFKSLLEGAVSGLTLPPHPKVEHTAIEDDEGAGFVVTSIPKSYLAPHQSIVGMQYYMRAGSDFVPVPHGVLAGMFGRAPQPTVFHMWTIPTAELKQNGAATFRVGLVLTNRSSAIAQDLFVNLTISPPPEPSSIGVGDVEPSIWSMSQAFGRITQIVSQVGFRLVPEALVTGLVLQFKLIPPFGKGLGIDVLTGCGGSPVKKFTHRLSAQELSDAYQEFVRTPSLEASSRTFIGKILGSPDGAG
jgi:hypothetical protein